MHLGLGWGRLNQESDDYKNPLHLFTMASRIGHLAIQALVVNLKALNFLEATYHPFMDYLIKQKII